MTPRLTDLIHLIEAIIGNPACRAELLALASMLAAKQMETLVKLAEQPAPQQSNRLLTAEQAAEILNLPLSSIYAHASQWSFTRRPTPGTLRFDEMGLWAWINGRKT